MRIVALCAFLGVFGCREEEAPVAPEPAPAAPKPVVSDDDDDEEPSAAAAVAEKGEALDVTPEAAVSPERDMRRARAMVLAIQTACPAAAAPGAIAALHLAVGLDEEAFQTALPELMADMRFAAAVEAGRQACQPETDERTRVLELLVAVTCAKPGELDEPARMAALVASHGLVLETWSEAAERHRKEPAFVEELLRRTDGCGLGAKSPPLVEPPPPPVVEPPPPPPIVEPPPPPIVEPPPPPPIVEPPPPPPIVEPPPPPPPRRSGCTSDRDCKGARICEDGQCVDPR